VFFANAVVDASCSYTYDARSRLTAAAGREHIAQVGQAMPGPDEAGWVGLAHPNDGAAMRRYTETYTYDAVGNLQQVAHGAGSGSWTRRYQYAAGSNRLDSTTLPGDPSTGPLPGGRYPHDARGNVVAMPHLAALGWDAKGRLHHLDLGGGGTVRFGYDASGQRVRKVTYRLNGTVQHEQLFLGPVQVERDYAGDGSTVTLERQTLHVQPGQLATIETRTAGQDAGAAQLVRFRTGDLIGSSRLELDVNGAVITYEEYHPYGTTSYQAVRSQTETPKRYRFAGKGRDEESGLYNYGARLYAAWLGRWVSADPAGLADGPNLFLFVRANPISTLDPNGTQSLGQQLTGGQYGERVHFKNQEEYRLSTEAAGLPTWNDDGSVDATVWRTRPTATLAPAKPQPKPTPHKPKPKVVKEKKPDPPVDAHTLFKLAEALGPHYTYPKGVTRLLGAVQLAAGAFETAGGIVTAVTTSETLVGAAAGGAVALHGIDNTTSGWTQVMTGEQAKTWTFQAAAGYASMATDDRELQYAIGSSVDTMANVASALQSLPELGTLQTAKLPGAATLLADADEAALAGSRINTGTGRGPEGLIAEHNCAFCVAAGANAVPSTSTWVAMFAGLREGVLSLPNVQRLLAALGLGDGVPLVRQVPLDVATRAMRGLPKTTKFAIWLDPAAGATEAHMINGRIGTFGLYFTDYQNAIAKEIALPFFSLPSNARSATVWVVYTP
jgi:RHS repeat-associated protein